MEELIPIFLFVSLAAVLILRPVSKKLGLLIEAMARERTTTEPHGRLEDAQLVRVTDSLERLNARIDLIDDRMAFMERLVEDRPARRRLSGS